MDSATKFYSRIANCFVAYQHCVANCNEYHRNQSVDKIEELVENYLPRGSGFDNGTKFNWEESNRNKLVFETAFHHMNDGGFYDGWSEHKVIITPDLLCGFNVTFIPLS